MYIHIYTHLYNVYVHVYVQMWVSSFANKTYRYTYPVLVVYNDIFEYIIMYIYIYIILYTSIYIYIIIYIYIHKESNLFLAIHLLPAGTSLPGTFEGSLQPLWSWQERSGRLAGAGQGRFNTEFTNKMWILTHKNGDLTNKCWWYNRR